MVSGLLHPMQPLPVLLSMPKIDYERIYIYKSQYDEDCGAVFADSRIQAFVKMVEVTGNQNKPANADQVQTLDEYLEQCLDYYGEALDMSDSIKCPHRGCKGKMTLQPGSETEKMLYCPKCGEYYYLVGNVTCIRCCTPKETEKAGRMLKGHTELKPEIKALIAQGRQRLGLKGTL